MHLLLELLGSFCWCIMHAGPAVICIHPSIHLLGTLLNTSLPAGTLSFMSEVCVAQGTHTLHAYSTVKTTAFLALLYAWLSLTGLLY